MKTFICLECDKENKWNYHNSGKYCDDACYQASRRTARNKLVESGQASAYQCKTYLIEKYGNECEKCGWSEVNPITGKVPIELEHIDGHHNNNTLRNLELLCPNCHSLTPTYKALNKGNGRKR